MRADDRRKIKRGLTHAERAEAKADVPETRRRLNIGAYAIGRSV